MGAKKQRTDSKGNPIPTLEEQLMQEAKDAAARKKAEKAYDEAEKSTEPAPIQRKKGGRVKKCGGGVMKKSSGGMAKKSSSSSVMPRGMGLMKKQKACKMY